MTKFQLNFTDLSAREKRVSERQKGEKKQNSPHRQMLVVFICPAYQGLSVTEWTLPRGYTQHIHRQGSAEHFWGFQSRKFVIFFILVIATVFSLGCQINAVLWSVLDFKQYFFCMGPVLFIRTSVSTVLHYHVMLHFWQMNCVSQDHFLDFAFWKVYFGLFRNTQLYWSLSVGSPNSPAGESRAIPVQESYLSWAKSTPGSRAINRAFWK